MDEYEEALHHLGSDTLAFGPVLADQVTDKLELGYLLSYSHRDYCGMGMAMNEKKEFLYGEIWDGAFSEPRIFPNRDLFVAWLAQQSTSSLARLDDGDFFSGNQIISRKRLLDFIAPDYPKLDFIWYQV
ncbi:hypothetical protein SAMN05421820_101652 [Pedobacter steynii]|uniref:Uncharacterized protein n=1 Tax=Pedobacter steynii TaxID=430522 RepID=A0A1G9KQR1_9SPHI|nr:hypothetical protein [Pedobacter steynii]NQX38621.1 hypothetical protein [Pedobacter steynii]SDL52108.1 hypothetical protein SAMN05421820_101652 [Pedobacter steynii]